MPGKLIEITPEVSLRATQVEMAFIDSMGDVFVKLVSGESLSVIPLPGETPEMTRRRIFQAVNERDASGASQLVEVGSGLYLSPADVTGVVAQRESVCIYLAGKGHYLITSTEPEQLAADIASRINTALHTAARGLNAI
ncbi:hypothetical protein NG99_04655 [Erwinia typographi]|uniref:Uncharacterized protein n=1 Tax=Erwinia typographi TaxID=371042 RepID=A0A0A3Z895_9GAMM|nr:hypothetical protein [Erwinia typographi]KGT95312.1 hypothetical protein NG99_04655 [Erwinia typographi]